MKLHEQQPQGRGIKRLYKTSVDTPCVGASGCQGSPANNGFYGHGVVNALNVVS